MSVVNKMLQDIDRRRAAAGRTPAAPAPGIASLPRMRRRRRWPVLGLLLGLLLAVVGWQNRDLFRASAPALPAPPAGPPVVSIPAPSAAPVTAAVPAAAEAPVAAAPAIALPKAENETVNTAQAGKEQSAAAIAESLRLSTHLSALTMAPVPAATKVPAAKVAAMAQAKMPSKAQTIGVDSGAPSIAIRQIAGDETVRAARALWNDGAHAAAIETLRQALATAESHRDAAAMPPLARELARFEVSENHPQAALDVLKRLENRFVDDAEAWALRGNAQQRLGQHAEAADSYRNALQLKGGESRWMLGAAISLAAIGKLDEARTWVQRAAERGPIPPAIAAYLTQLGVPAS